MKGVDPGRMMAQMYGKANRPLEGRDSALHSGIPELGIFGNTSMLGSNLPVAAGLGLTFRWRVRTTWCWPTSARARATRGTSTKA